MNKKTMLLIIFIALVLILIGVVAMGVIDHYTYKVDRPIATMTIEGYDEPMVFELYPEYAPNTVKNFIALANNGFYDGLKIHRIEEYVIQGGDPKGDGTGSPTLSAINPSIEKDSEADKEYSIYGEFLANGFKKNKLVHEVGTLSMARSSYTMLSQSLAEEGNNSGGSQFFICTQYMQGFNGEYAAFGNIISGMDTLMAIRNVELKTEVNEETKEETKTTEPKEDIIIKSVTVDTKGIDYGMPETQDVFDYSDWFTSQISG